MTEQQFTDFYEGTRRRVLAYLARASGNPGLAEDLMQEAYIRFLTSSPPELAAGEATKYLFRIASNLLVDHWRKHKMESTGTDPEQQGGREPAREAAMDLRTAFAQLSERERSLLWLAYVEGYDHRQISESLDVKTASVKVLLSRARSKLLAWVKPKESR
jgi:RNA polymerase sigma-70 factor, ECF subfamily